MLNSEVFLSYFNKIEDYLQDLIGGHRMDFRSMAWEGSRRFGFLRRYRGDLLEFCELRNAIVHDYKDGKTIAEPTDEAVEDIKELYEALTNPQKVLSIASSPVKTAMINDKISEVVALMKKEKYTHMPIYENNQIIGVFSESTLLKWLGVKAQSDGFVLDAVKIGEIKEFLDQEDDQYNAYTFVPRETLALDIEEDFKAFLKQEKRLGAVFVTENGKKEEDLLGIVTAWDLPKIKSQGR